jgi:hypothetical protein
MRRSSVASLLALTAGLAATAALRRLARRRSVPASVVPAAPVPVAAVETPPPGDDAVVLPFARKIVAPAADQPRAAVRCGDNGGVTKAGAPCGSRATSGGRCHHHRVAA